MAGDSNHRFLNREGRWADFEWRGLELRPDGALQLRSLPRFAGALSPELATLPDPSGPAGVAAVPGGHVYFTDPDGHRLLLVDGCDGTQRPTACSTGRPGGGPGELDTPRGLAHHARRDSLLVADSGNDRILVLALPSLEVSEVWDGRDRPVSLAHSPDGRTFVVDAGSAEVVEIDVLGHASAFEPDLEAAEVAVTGPPERPLVVVLDVEGGVHVVDEGSVETWPTGLHGPLGLAASSTSVFVGDRAGRRLAVFGLDGTLVGPAHGYSGPVAALALDHRGGLLVHPGDAIPPIELEPSGAHQARGLVWGGPFQNPSDASEPRHLIRARVERGEGAHLGLHLAEQGFGSDGEPVEDPPPVAADADNPFADPRWRALEPDAAETLFAGAPLEAVWVGMTFSSEGLASPVLDQIRLDFDHETWLTHLPAVYERERAPDDVLARWLTLFESTFDSVHDAIAGLARLFDPAAAPPAWLPWLAEWLAADAPEGWPADRLRQLISEAFDHAGRRGTAAGLREALREDAGLSAVVEEPLRQMSWWALPDNDPSDAEAALSVLGSGTVLAVGEAGGAVVASSAILDGSFLAPQDRFATALFADVAHQFTVRLYRGAAYSEDAVAAARAIIDAERPAHTQYHVCLVEPAMRVGLQARVGMDALVGDPNQPDPADAAREGGLQLGGDPAGRLGTTAHVGRTHL